MCAPKAPKTSQIQVPPQRMAAVLPDGGDPLVRQSLRGARGLARSAMIFTNQTGALGMPAIATLGGGA